MRRGASSVPYAELDSTLMDAGVRALQWLTTILNNTIIHIYIYMDYIHSYSYELYLFFFEGVPSPIIRLLQIGKIWVNPLDWLFSIGSTYHMSPMFDGYLEAQGIPYPD